MVSQLNVIAISAVLSRQGEGKQTHRASVNQVSIY